MKSLRKLLKWLAILVAAFPALLQAETKYFNGSDFKAGYYIVPDELPTGDTKLWVMVDVHGAGGLKREQKNSWMIDLVAPTPVIVLVPSFTTGYQGGDGKWADQLIENFKTIQKEYPVHDKMFVHGFSGGGQFAHRFTMNEPKYVIACSAHSSGSWACDGGYGEISSKAKDIPFFISCGEKDTAYSVKGYPHTRIEWYKLFAAALEKKQFTYLGKSWPDTGHRMANGLKPLVGELFHLATAGTRPTSEGWVRLPDLKEAPGQNLPLTLSESDKTTIRAATASINSGNAPDAKATLRFLAKYPASKWADEKEFAPLADHCRKIIDQYVKERESSGSPLSGDALTRFQEATKGL